MNNGIIIILGGAGFCPSTVSSGDSWKYPDPNVGPHPVKTALYYVGIYGLQS